MYIKTLLFTVCMLLISSLLGCDLLPENLFLPETDPETTIYGVWDALEWDHNLLIADIADEFDQPITLAYDRWTFYDDQTWTIEIYLVFGDNSQPEIYIDLYGTHDFQPDSTYTMTIVGSNTHPDDADIGEVVSGVYSLSNDRLTLIDIAYDETYTLIKQ